MLEPLSVSRLRRNPTRDVALLLAHVDALVDEVDRLEVPLTLSPEAVLEVAGPSTDEIGDQDVWILGAKDLVRLAAAILEAAMKARA